MRARRLRYRFTNRSYALRRWPHSRAMLPTQTSAEMRQLSLLDCCRIAGLSTPKISRTAAGISHKAIQNVARAQERLMRRNAYHNPAHIGQVIIAAGLLADSAELGQIERDVLILAALIHDYGHLGAVRSKQALWQEASSCKRAIPILVRGGMDSRLCGLLREMVLATSPAVKPEGASLKGNDILSLLLDADLFASLFLPHAIVDALTGALKYEDRLTIERSALRENFLTSCQNRGFASLAAAELHQRLQAGMTYFKVS